MMEPVHGRRASGDDGNTEQIEVLGRWIDGILKEQRSSRRWKIITRLIMLAVLAAFLTAYTLLLIKGPAFFIGGDEASSEAHIAVVQVQGPITSDGQASADRIISGLRGAFDSDSAEAVVLRINSPGGSPVQSQRVYQEILRLKAEGGKGGIKPVYAVIEDIGASGAYYIAAAADNIVVSPSSLVGSIGVIHAGFGFQGALDSLGIERRVFTAGESKSFLDAFKDVSPEQRDFWQGVLETVHSQFVADVKATRGDALTDDPDLFSGLIWSGEQAIEKGLADMTGDASWVSRDLLDGEHRLVDYTPKGSLFDRVGRQFGVSVAAALGLETSHTPVMLLPE